jgi:6-pyruvoyl-tetrahydropterin synthase-like protein
LAIIFLIAGIAAVSPFFLHRDANKKENWGLRIIWTHDLPTHLVVMEEFDQLLRAGIVYPRWLPNINKGYGNLTLNFYPPGFYYLTSLVDVATHDWTVTLYLISALALAASGLAMYFLCRQFFGRAASMIASLFYMLLPYHLIDLYWRGAMPEFIGFVLIPLVVYFAFKVGGGSRPRHYVGLGLVYGLHLFMHFPVSYLLTYALALYAVLWAVKERDYRITLRIAAGMALGLMLAAIYWLPAALESNLVQEFVSDIFPYEGTLLTLIGGSNTFDFIVNHTFIAQTVALLVAIAIVLAYYFKKTSQLEKGSSHVVRTQIWLWVILGVTTTFMNTILAKHIARLIPKIQATVPAWRWLAIASVFTALLVAAAADHLLSRDNLFPRMVWIYRSALILAIIANIWISVRAVHSSLSNGTMVPIAMFLQSGFTPKGSYMPDQLPESAEAILRYGSGSVSVVRWGPLEREVQVTTNQPSLIRLRSYYFPGWKARIDGQDAELVSDSTGVQNIMVPEGHHTVEVFYTDTPPRTAGMLLSVAAFIAACALVAAERAGSARALKRYAG